MANRAPITSRVLFRPLPPSSLPHSPLQTRCAMQGGVAASHQRHAKFCVSFLKKSEERAAVSTNRDHI